MKLYFSGIGGRPEADIIHGAGVDKIVVDCTDWRHVAAHPAKWSVIVDSGAYRAWKKGTPLTVDTWAQSLPKADNIEAYIMPDVIGNWAETKARWEQVKGMALPAPLWPVWTWGAPMVDLRALLAQAPIVCVGGMVRLFRDKDRRALAGIMSVAGKYGDQLHILGMNSLAAIDLVGPIVRSFDTSKWLDGARYATSLRVHNNRLFDRPAREDPLWSSFDRRTRCHVWARTLHHHCNHVKFVPNQNINN